MIRLEPVDPGNWRLGLTVSAEQRRYVSDDMRILARAYAYRESRSQAFIICCGDTPVGMAMYHDWEERAAYDFSQFFIDRRYQGRGYGIEAVGQILDRMRRDGKYQRVILCIIDGNEAARRMYERLGFHLTGERDEDEVIMEMSL